MPRPHADQKPVEDRELIILNAQHLLNVVWLQLAAFL